MHLRLEPGYNIVPRDDYNILSRLRIGAFITQSMAERISSDIPKRTGRCPCCNNPLFKDSMDHFIWTCTAFNDVRRDLQFMRSTKRLLTAAGLVPINTTSTNHHSNLTTLLCGGTVSSTPTSPTSLLGKSVDVGTDDGKNLLEKIVLDEIPADRRQQPLSRLGYFLLASYLQRAIPRRNKFLWGPSKPTPLNTG